MSTHAPRRTLRRLERASVETLESRRLLCSMPHELLIPAPEFNWEIEHREAERLARDGGPEATSIVWTNRGQASDGFSANFGTSAATGRAVVDAVLDSWERIITDWNRDDETTTLQVNISVTNSNGNGGAAAPAATAPADGKPRTGSITLLRGNVTADPNDSNSWFFDPTPFDNSEFMGNIISAYAGAESPAIGADLFSVVSSELAHVLGIISDFGNDGGAFDGYLLEDSDFATFTDIDDNAEGGGNGHFWVFDGPTIDHLMTSFNSGDPTDQSWGNVVHTAGAAGDIDFAGQNWIGSEDTGNAIFGNERTLPSFATANILKDAYGYTVTDPETFGTFYAVLNQTTGVLTVRGGAGTSVDAVVIQLHASGQLQVSVDVGHDVPGTGHLAGPGNLGAFSTLFDVADVTSIVVTPGDGGDILNVANLPDGIELTADMGGGDDTVNVGGNEFDSNILANIDIDGQAGTDRVQFSDASDTSGNDTYTLTATTFDKTSFNDTFTYASIESITLNCSPFDNTINVTSLAAATNFVNVNGGPTTGDGDDTFNVGGNNFDANFGASVSFNGGPGTDRLSFNDTADAGDDTYTLVTGGIGKSSTTEEVNYFNTELVTLNAGPANHTINLRSAAAPVTDLTITAGDGNDAVVIGAGDVDNTILADVFINGGAGTGDTVTFNDTADGGGSDTWTITSISLDKPLSGTVTYSTVEGVTVNGSPQNDTFNFVSSASATPIAINANGGNDDFVLSPTAFNMTALDAALDLDGGAGTDDIIANDQNTPAPGSFSINTFTTTTFTIANMPTATHSFIETLTYNGSQDGSLGRVQTLPTGFALDINGGLGSDSFLVGEAATGGLNTLALANSISVNGGDGIGGDTLTVNDSSSGGLLTYTLTSAALDRSTFGILNYAAVSSINLTTGSGNDTINVNSITPGDAVAINANAGGDTFNLGSATGGVDPLDGTLAVNGQDGTDTVNVNDQAENVALTFTIDDTTVARSGMGTVTYGTVEQLNVRSSATTATTHAVNDTAPGTPLRITGGAAADTIHVVESNTTAPVTVAPSLGNDTVNVNASGVGVAHALFDASVTLASLNIGAGGSAALLGDGSRVLRTSSLTVNGSLDLRDNAMIVDYAGASPLTAIVARLTSGYAGGAWNGPGINSSAAAANPGRALGYAEASALFSTFPATFAGQSVDNTTVLVRYTRYGDANLDGQVNLADFNRLASGFGSGSRWDQGNFNYDALVNLQDFNLLASNFGQAAAALEALLS